MSTGEQLMQSDPVEAAGKPAHFWTLRIILHLVWVSVCRMVLMTDGCICECHLRQHSRCPTHVIVSSTVIFHLGEIAFGNQQVYDQFSDT